MAETLRVLVIGPAPTGPESRGGMATVMRLMLDDPDPRFRLRVIPTYVDGTVLRRLRVGTVGVATAGWSLLRGRHDVLHVHLSHRGSVARKSLPLLIARTAGVPAVVHGHSFDFAGWFDGLPGPARALVRAALPADRWLVLGEGLARDYARCLGLPAESVEVLHNPVRLQPPRAERPAGDPVRVVSLGRLGQRKGTYDLIAALTLLPDSVRERMRVVIAGDGEVAEAESAAARSGVLDILTVRGWVEPDERDRLLDQADVFVLPSYEEGLPMALLEAMSRGLVPVTTPVGSIAEIVDDRADGLLVVPGDTAALARALELLVTDPPLRLRLAVSARARMAACDLDGWHRRLGVVWSEVAAGTRR